MMNSSSEMPESSMMEEWREGEGASSFSPGAGDWGREGVREDI